MSLRGVLQLKKVVIRYSDKDGSSQGIRQWIHSNSIPFAVANPTIFIRTILKRNKHPILTAFYQNGNSKVICVKNENVKKIQEQVTFLRNQIGRKMNSTGYKRPVISKMPSIQGEWHERMDLIDLPVQFIHKP